MLDFLTMRAELAAHYDLAPSEALAEEMRDIYEKMDRVVPWPDFVAAAPYIAAINRLKAEQGAVILAHNYMTPDIYHGVADFVGDSLQLAIKATEVEADTIIQCGVHFMAETSKILNPAKRVIIPDQEAGCSLAESITGAGIEEMRAKYPGAPVVSYVNTTADVKAASDICCTSSNAAAIVRAMESDVVIMTPDQYLAQNVAAEVPEKTVVWWEGSCIVHERFTAQDLRDYKHWNPETQIIAHPECPPDVVAESDFSGSTAGIIKHVMDTRPKQALLVTECSMASNISDEVPDVEFVGPCNMCPYMKKITLEKILWSLHTGQDEVEVDPEIAEKARVAVERMIDLSQKLGI